jgi:protein-disulfide isomerase
LPEISKQYIDSGRVQLAFRHHPIAQLHSAATKAAEAALCAGRHGKFWEMHAALFQDQHNLDQVSLMTRARVLGLDESSFRACLGGAVLDQVQEDLRTAEDLGLSGTPAFLIGTRMADGRVKVSEVLVGAQPVERFQRALDAAATGSASLGLSVWIEVGAGLVALIVAGLPVLMWRGIFHREVRSW